MTRDARHDANLSGTRPASPGPMGLLEIVGRRDARGKHASRSSTRVPRRGTGACHLAVSGWVVRTVSVRSTYWRSVWWASNAARRSRQAPSASRQTLALISQCLWWAAWRSHSSAQATMVFRQALTTDRITTRS
jgi:hypothetical protein